MPEFIEHQRRLILHYDKGQFTFRHIDDAASHSELHELATYINAVQDEPLEKITLVRTLVLVL